MDIRQIINNTVDHIKSKTNQAPTIGLILGSGLGDFADGLENKIVIPFSDIPDFPRSTVAGHKGAFVIGECHGKTGFAVLFGEQKNRGNGNPEDAAVTEGGDDGHQKVEGGTPEVGGDPVQNGQIKADGQTVQQIAE